MTSMDEPENVVEVVEVEQEVADEELVEMAEEEIVEPAEEDLVKERKCPHCPRAFRDNEYQYRDNQG